MHFIYKSLAFVLAVCVVVTKSQESRSQLVNDEIPYIISVWQVSAITDEHNVTENHNIFKCTGALVSEKHVLTTVSCIDQTKAGVGSLVSGGHLKRNDVSDIIFHDVIEVIRHEDYDDVTKDNDLAMLTISPGFEAEPHIYPVKIHKQQTEPGSLCTAAGWRLSFYYTNDDLRTKTVFRLEDAACNDVIQTYRSLSRDDDVVQVGRDYVRDDVTRTAEERLNFGGRKICAGDRYGEECTIGDEGGPLVCDDALTGIFSSYVLVCLQSSPEPAFYHDVAQYADWIIAHAPGVEVSDKSAASFVNYSLATLALVLAVVGVLN